MSDEQTPETTETTVTEVKTGLEPSETFSKEYVQELRNEAAKYRSKVKTSVEEAKEAVKAEYEGKIAEKDTAFTELESQLGAAGIELTKLRIALAMNVPSDRVLAFAEILKGSTEDEIESSAKSAYELFGGGFKSTSPAFDPTQGHGGGDLPLNGDKLLDALKRVVGA